MNSMTTEFFKAIFGYHHHFNQRLIVALHEHKNVLPERTYPLFCHVINAHGIWNARITGSAGPGLSEAYPLSACREFDEMNYAGTLKILETLDLNETITYRNSRDQEFTNNVLDILFHVSNHSTHHKGQIVSDFRSKGIEPVVTDYIFYRR